VSFDARFVSGDSSSFQVPERQATFRSAIPHAPSHSIVRGELKHARHGPPAGPGRCFVQAFKSSQRSSIAPVCPRRIIPAVEQCRWLTVDACVTVQGAATRSHSKQQIQKRPGTISAPDSRQTGAQQHTGLQSCAGLLTAVESKCSSCSAASSQGGALAGNPPQLPVAQMG
jgi:hypothetical protein